uniref:uncharacterized protein LOC120329698 isoform X5 n=1 Tax=Styela clava TaxID=7725 RepID=UPI001939CC9A|nr:uncharacterized protein LOC120329698 isoform X5 [Styela clava]
MKLIIAIFLVAFTLHWDIGNSAEVSEEAGIRGICKEICAVRGHCTSPKAKSCQACKRNCWKFINTIELKENEAEVEALLSTVRRLVELAGTRGDQGEETTNLLKILVKAMIQQEDNEIADKRAKKQREKDMKMICKEVCVVQGHCKSRRATRNTCSTCRERCFTQIDLNSNNIVAEEETMKAIKKAYQNKKDEPTWNTESMSELIRAVGEEMSKFQATKKPEKESAKPEDKGSHLQPEKLCKAMCKFQGVCEEAEDNCRTCTSECIKQLDSNKMFENIDGETKLQLEILLLVIRNSDDNSLIESPEMSKIVKDLLSKIRGIDITEEEDEEKGGEKENKDLLLKPEELCKAMCKFQGVCAEAEDNCRTCTSECIKQLDSKKIFDNINEETKLQLERLLLVIRNSDDDSLIESPEMSKIVKDLLSKIRGIDVTVNEEQEYDLKIEKVCKAMCKFQGQCKEEFDNCRICTSECSAKLDSSKLFENLDEETKLQLERLLLIIRNSDDDSLLETSEMSKLVKDLLQKIIEIEIVEEKSEYDLKIGDVCKAMCQFQGQCKEGFDNCRICTSECSAEFARLVGTDSLDERSQVMLQKLLLVISNADTGSIMKTEEMSMILKELLQNLTKTNKSNKNQQETKRQPTEVEYMLCDEVCKMQGKCNSGNSPECKSCSDKCLKTVNITNGMIALDQNTFDQYRKLMSIVLVNLQNNSNLMNLLGSDDIEKLQRLFLVASTSEDDIFLNDPETIQFMMSVIRKLENSTLVSIVTDDENKESLLQSEELCKTMCKFQGVCAEAEDNCRTCTSECIKQLVSNKMLENIDEETKLQLERLLLVIRNSDDDSLLETPEMSKLVKDLLQKIRGMDIVEEKENVDKENEAEFQFKKLCKAMCNLQGMCIEDDTQNCKICTKECVKQLKSDEYIQSMNRDSEFPLEELLLVISNVKPVSSKVLQNLDEETKLQLERFLLVIGNGDSSILMSSEMSNIMKDLLTKLREIDVNGKTVEGEMGDSVTQSKKACETMCKFQRMCLNENSNNCKSCILECTEKLFILNNTVAKQAEINKLDDDTKIMLERLLLVLSSTNDTTILESKEMTSFINNLLIKLRGIEISEEHGNDLNLEKICKAMCKFQSQCKEEFDNCRTCSSECSTELAKLIGTNQLDKESQVMMNRLLLVISNVDADSMLNKADISKQLKDLISKLTQGGSLGTKEVPGKPTELSNLLCDEVCKMQNKCDLKDSSECKTCVDECSNSVIISNGMIKLDDNTFAQYRKLMSFISLNIQTNTNLLDLLDSDDVTRLQRLFLVASTSEDDTALNNPEMLEFLMSVIVKLQNATAIPTVTVAPSTESPSTSTNYDDIEIFCKVICWSQNCSPDELSSNNCQVCRRNCVSNFGENENLKTPEGIKLLKQLTESVKINADGSITVNSDTDKYLAKLTQVIYGHASTASPTMTAQTTKPVQYLSTKMVCKMKCADRCMNRTSRREILDEVPRKCRSCIRTICNLFRMYNTDCPFDTMENQCIKSCPLVQNDIKELNGDCGVCFENCVLRERQKRKLVRRRQRGA